MPEPTGPGSAFDEIAGLYSPQLKQLLEGICNDEEHPLIVLVNDRDAEGNVQTDEAGNILKKAAVSNVNALYHINRVWNPFYYGGDLFIHDPENHYHRMDTDDVLRNVMACFLVLGHPVKPGKIKEILSQIVNHTAVYPFGKRAGALNVLNGVINLESGELEPHSNQDFFDYVIKTPYKKFDETPELYAFLDGYGNREPIAALAKALWQRGFLDTLKELTVFYGDRDSGKTTAAELIQATLDGDLKTKANTSRVLLHELLQRFGLAGLEHKTLNIGDDLPDMFVRGAGRINELVGSVHHNVEKKGKDHFPTVLPAYNLFTTNSLPPLDDDDAVIWSKIRLVRFDQKFARGTIRETLFTETIKEQLLFRAVELLRTWKETPYVNDQTADEVRAIWHEATTSTDTFIAECLAVDWESPTSLQAIEDRYDRWCRENGKHRHVKAMRKALQPAMVRKSFGNRYAYRIIPSKTGSAGSGPQTVLNQETKSTS